MLDAGVQLARYFQEPEADAPSLAGLELRRAAVPWIWPLEIINGLLLGLRRGRLSRLEVDEIVSGMSRLGVDADPVPPNPEAILVLAQGHGLTAYDAAYLELALRRHLPLATVDPALQTAARRAGVPLIA